MRKFLTIICFCIFFNNLSSAGTLYGMGDFEISKKFLNHIYDYLVTLTKNKKRGAKRAGPGTYFAVAESERCLEQVTALILNVQTILLRLNSIAKNKP